LAYQDAMRPGGGDVLVTAKGRFRAALTQIDFDRLWMQYGDEELPRVIYTSTDRTAIGFLSDANQANIKCAGIDVGPGEIVVFPAGVSFHDRTSGPCCWGAMSLTPDDLTAAAYVIVGHDLLVRPVTQVVRPHGAAMARLSCLHDEARRLPLTAPEMFAHPEVSRALEQALVHAMITSLAGDESTEVGRQWRHHSAIIRRFEALLAANSDRAMHLPEICAAVGASERTLRTSCEDHLGMGPVRYLWLRRMHLARRALTRGDPAKMTVTRAATDYGFWELGRFAVSYRHLFGESPSATLHGPRGKESVGAARKCNLRSGTEPTSASGPPSSGLSLAC
jgi:AraC-like DNA-binding protein